MDKTAQKREWHHELREKLDWPGRTADKWFKPQFTRVMSSLVSKDDAIRSVLMGKKYGKPDPAVQFENISAKDLLNQAKSYINRREYISAVSSLSRFHKKMQDITNIVSSLNFDVSKIHHQFLFGKKVPDKKYMEHLSDFEKRIAAQQAEFIKRAGLVDTWNNLFSERGRSLRKWEKLYGEEKRIAAIREGTKTQLEAAQSLLATVLEHVKEMSSLRAARKVDAYVAEAANIKNAFQTYDTSFRSFYNTTIKPEVEIRRQKNNEEAVELAKNIPVPTTSGVPEGVVPEVGPTGTMRVIPSAEVFKPTPPGNSPVEPPDTDPSGLGQKPGQNKTFKDTIKETEEKINKQLAEKAKKREENKTIAHTNFISSLEIFSNEDPILLAAHLSKYARSIQREDPNVAIQLFKIAKSLRG